MTAPHIYHCICSQIVIATAVDLTKIKERQLDSSRVIIGDVLLHNALQVASEPIMLRLEDGFEKRYPQKCPRCAMTVAYRLDRSHWEGALQSGSRDDVLFLLPDAVATTSDMITSKAAS